MKKIILFLAMAVVTLSEVVTVDMQYLIANHPKSTQIKKDLDVEKDKLEKILNDKADALSLEKEKLEAKKDKITEAEIVAFQKKEEELNKLYNDSQKSLLTLKNTKLNGLYEEIVTAIKTLQKTKKYDAIVDKGSVYAGQEKLKDSTSEVLNILNSSEKIELK